ncbi:helix-turn-helix transcriptional regulator [Saccharothrix hoggarensis]|uniref:Helix-turn-helix transcriptional regulator n=1 Tax=Saccharothrix hoggarensis TaxID=913853 RepID=A0ABW3QTK6_9PSEU
MSGNEFDRLWGVDDLSAFLGVPVHTIRGWRSKNYGPPARKVGKHLRWDPEKVREWFNGLGQNAA